MKLWVKVVIAVIIIGILIMNTKVNYITEKTAKDLNLKQGITITIQKR
jgi:hypothetical protein